MKIFLKTTMPFVVALIAATVSTGEDLYRLTVDDGTGSGEYPEGTIVNITADACSEGEIFEKWETVSGGIGIYNSTSPVTNVTTVKGNTTIARRCKQKSSAFLYRPFVAAMTVLGSFFHMLWINQ
mmetsp:Transcript_5595/g.7008  ORF Transcript_5595/g.7008 Transcript_5595/m.7008 type:complete len:125 (+) Transcript_5595:60-434(+)